MSIIHNLAVICENPFLKLYFKFNDGSTVLKSNANGVNNFEWTWKVLHDLLYYKLKTNSYEIY